MRAFLTAIWVLVLAGSFDWSMRQRTTAVPPEVHSMDGGSGEPPPPAQPSPRP